MYKFIYIYKIYIDSLAHGLGPESNLRNVRNLFTDVILLVVMISSDDIKVHWHPTELGCQSTGTPPSPLAPHQLG